MLESVKNIILQLLTESDNRTHDIYRYMALGTIVSGIGCQCYAIAQGQPFSMQEFGIGMGALLAGVGVALGLKKEPCNKEGG